MISLGLTLTDAGTVIAEGNVSHKTVSIGEYVDPQPI
jgi:hypothetical protein